MHLQCTNAATVNLPLHFANRHHAGLHLAEALREFSDRSDVTVLALPRGGVPVARPIADALRAPLDVLVVRKLGAPGHEELALGAIGEGSTQVRHTDAMQALGITASVFDEIAARERQELDRRALMYRRDVTHAPIRDRIVILVDDGVATGATMEVTIAAVRQRRPAQIVVAVPVGAPNACRRLAALADKVVCLLCPTAASRKMEVKVS
ncbi:MAG: phosphoribosyltransferase [Acidimicrobiia bacterium]|nr:phosphoribosyltransferase [Acidimicrobiia bacterium]